MTPKAGVVPGIDWKWIRISGLCLASVLLLCIGFRLSGVEKALETFGHFPIWTIVGVLMAFVLNLAVVSFRLKRLLTHIGIPLSFSVAFKTCVQGQFGALFLISLFGQVMGRHWALRAHGVSSMTVALLTVIERFAMFFVCALLCLSGALWLLDDDKISAFLHETSFPLILATVLFSLLMSLWMGRSKLEARIFSRISALGNVGNFLEINAVTLLSQSLVLGAFVLAGKGLIPGAGCLDLLAAAAITSFAASMPISIGGWGVRELTAIFAFGHIGVPTSSALAISILIGLASTMTILAVWPFICGKGDAPRNNEDQIYGKDAPRPSPHEMQTRIPMEKIGAWGLSMATAILVFFQIHLPLFGGEIALNLADPFAIVSLAVVVAYAINERALPVWRIPGFNKMLLAMTLLLVFSFVWGVRTIGVTQWALTGRLIGWLLLLGYVSIGVLTISWLGRQGMRRFLETFVITAGTVVISCAVVRWMIYSGWLDIEFPHNFEGYAGNRNAFAFQMLICAGLFFAWSSHQRKTLERLRAMRSILSSLYDRRYAIFGFFHGAVLAGLLFSGSRAGVGTILLLLFVSVVFAGLTDRKVLMQSLAHGFAIYLSFTLISLFSFGLQGVHQIDTRFSASAASNIEHLESIRHGLMTWKNQPFFGAGLGVSLEESTLWHGDPIVIHSTPVWILADFGLLGALILGTIYVGMLLFSCRRLSGAPPYRAVVLILGIFAVFSLVHEIFYQRIFWLILGACIALPFRPQIPYRKPSI
jgi:uncharacterized membrane protein YbhN (UPF0104 family)